mmetsp:Transcript_4462/g.8741  ORF Transcript_4462/g.8741 Transcript_4462/m.8741 type:complete len:349 (+) Transcript_4462:224-1270(+)|eukprot:CAMPEP_0173382224 /NCGR_PEP_ID=MMETSP1356-20130122/4705_1 /TAXON_ID=77927 ORGANISM="Hemiselmis virescens, Strain PCC157" /NCGR_SAMPLE_ID=MMETSP1356 /ASSEMBLY_ACC=CAM_ASM_000847 /LENGTH=348 /DNA_ID=CAMNT_0014336451 /DNA_START=198 /DNA_END=1244 /DNA_ORIENTATION=-
MCRPGQERFPPACSSMEDVREALRSLLQGMAALHESGGAVGRLNPSCLAATPGGSNASSSPCSLKRVVCPRGRALVERSTGGAWHVMRPASQHSQEPEEDGEGAISPPAMRRFDGPDEKIWYRAPELQVQSIEDVLCRPGAPRDPACCAGQSAASDVWAVGCMFAEMTNGGEPLFGVAETEFQLLSAHCDYAGYEYTSDEIEIRSEAGSGAYTLRDLVPSMCDCAFDLFKKMLSCDWRERITMAEALQHDFMVKCRCALQQGSPPRVAGDDWSASHLCPDGEPHSAHCAPMYTSYAGFLASDNEGGPCLPAELASLVEEHKFKKRAGLKRGRCPSTPSSPAPKRERVA